MDQFHKMLEKISSSKYHNSMMKFARPLEDYFGINHFWYYKVTYSGYYSFLGTHSEWNHYTFENQFVDQFPCLRDPDSQISGVNLMKKTHDTEYKRVLHEAWNKFRINFNLNLVSKTPEGVEAFGFATKHNHPMADEMLLNELSLLKHITGVFREKHRGLFELLNDNQVDFATYLGKAYKDKQRRLNANYKRNTLLQDLNLLPARLTKRERDILKFVARGYPASFIASKLFLSRRTVENYIDTIKGKLFCESKVELIKKAHTLAEIGYIETI